MNPGKLNLVCPQGATLLKTFKLYDKNDAPVDLTGFTSGMQVRKTMAAKTSIVNLTTENGGIDISGNVITVHITYQQSELFPCGDFFWDIEITSPLDVRDRIIQGKFLVTPEVTR